MRPAKSPLPNGPNVANGNGGLKVRLLVNSLFSAPANTAHAGSGDCEHTPIAFGSKRKMSNAICKVQNGKCKMTAMAALILSIDTREQFDRAVAKAVEMLKAGEVVALPTETVYGLAANAFDADAVRRIFELKGRPARNPIIVHIANREMALDCVTEWSDSAERLAKAFWPGPLTLVLPKSAKLPDIVTATGPTVGVRWPSH